MQLRCPAKCLDFSSNQNPDFRPIVRKGYFFRSSDSKYVARFQCKNCNKKFSLATFNPCFGQKKRRLNPWVKKMLCEGNSMNAIARQLKIHRITVARKRKFLSQRCQLHQNEFLKVLNINPVKNVQMDELETFELTKCKPLSVALAVSDDPETKRLILGFEVSVMPAKGLLARISREKYGLRPDQRSEGIKRLLTKVSTCVRFDPHITTDQNPRYPFILKEYWPNSIHQAVKGKRGCITGQGELKKVGFDPLFSLNHTCAMLRDHLSRLARKTWCTTKTIEALIEHLNIYVDYHNLKLLKLNLTKSD